MKKMTLTISFILFLLVPPLWAGSNALGTTDTNNELKKSEQLKKQGDSEWERRQLIRKLQFWDRTQRQKREIEKRKAFFSLQKKNTSGDIIKPGKIPAAIQPKGDVTYTPLTIDAPFLSAEIYPSGEQDYYQFTVVSGGYYVIKTWPGTLDISYMHLYGPDDPGQLIEESSSTKIYRYFGAGTYYVMIDSWSSGTYTIGVGNPGAISGKVTNSSAIKLQNVRVGLCGRYGDWVGETNTDANGDYSFTGLAAGQYKVHFDCYYNGLNYLPEWYNHKNDWDTADAIVVAAGSTTANINVQLVSGGNISGRVTDSSAAGIKNIHVCVFDLESNCLGCIATDANGNYTITQLAAGSYKVHFNNNNQNYISEFYNDKRDSDEANTVTVTSGSTIAGINARLSSGGIISGRVTDSASSGIEDIHVSVYDADANFLGNSSTDYNGNYSVAGLPAGSHKVKFDDEVQYGEEDGEQIYLTEWYNNKTSFAAADPVAVTVGSTTPNINARLSAGDSISGRVTAATGVGIDHIEVDVHDLSNCYIGVAYTNANGVYSVDGLAPGSYKVQFYADGENYLGEWYNDKSDFASANPVTVIAGSTTSNINARLAAGGSISGKVTDSSAVGIPYIPVQVYDLANNQLGYATTNINGDYSLPGLATGSYKICFNKYSGQNYLVEWYNDKGDFAAADPVAVTAGSTTSGINAQLSVGGTISGRVTDSASSGIENIQVWVYDSESNILNVDYYTDAHGYYSVPGLPTGNLKVKFDTSYHKIHVTEWYNDKASFVAADPVAVTAGSTTENIDAQLSTGGTISGRVTNFAHSGIENIEIYVYDLDHSLLRDASTDANGDYSFAGLATGSYKVYFFEWAKHYISQWYNVKGDFASADPVAVTAGSTTLNIDAQLEGVGTTGAIAVISPNGSESWKVDESHDITWSSTGAIASVNIDYSTDSGNSWVPVAVGTANDGAYSWIVPDAPSTTCLVRISNAAGSGIDSSDAVFIIWTDTHKISGKISSGGSGLASVVLNGLPGNPVTDGSGFYSVRVDPGWSGTVTPARQYFTFAPASSTYTSVSSNQTTNYTASLIQSLVVASPATGSVWETGTTHSVLWLKRGAQNAYVRINLYKGTSTWVAILAAKTANDGSFDWLMPKTLAAGGNYFIRVQTIDSLIRDDSDKFSIIVPAITVTSPATGTVWVKGTSKTITWNKVGTQDANVRIQLYRGTTKVLDITASTSNSGTYDWAIPPTLAKALYTVRITTLDGKVKGVSKGFTIANGMIKVTAPAAGARWQRGIVHAITWTSEGTVNANVRIQLLKGDQVAAIAATTPNDGSFDWTIPAGRALANYKIRVTTVDNLVTGDSGIFAITSSAGLVLLSPNGDEILKPTTGQTILWSVDPDVLEVKLEFSRDNGSTFATIADHVANTGRYEWQVPVNFTRNGIVRVSDSNGKFWQDDGLLEFSFKFIYGGEGDEAGAVFWFGSSDVNAPGYGFARIAVGRGKVQFGGIDKTFEPLSGGWHELRVRFDFRRDTAEIRLDDQPMFENAALNTTREHYFQPCLVVQTGGGAPLDFIVDDLAINVVQPDDSGQDRQVFNVLADDFDRYDERSNVLQNCWQWRNADGRESKVELQAENMTGKVLRLQTESGKKLMICLPIALPERVPFDISDKNLVIENQ